MNKSAFNYKSSRTYGIHYSTPIYSKPSQSTNQTFIICPQDRNVLTSSTTDLPINVDSQTGELISPGMVPHAPRTSRAESFVGLPKTQLGRDVTTESTSPQTIPQTTPQVSPQEDDAENTRTPLAATKRSNPQSSTPVVTPRQPSATHQSRDEVHGVIAMIYANHIRKNADNKYDKFDRLILTGDDFCVIIASLAEVSPNDVILQLTDPEVDGCCAGCLGGCFGCCFGCCYDIPVGIKTIAGISIAQQVFRPISGDSLQVLSRLYNFSITEVLVGDMMIAEDSE